MDPVIVESARLGDPEQMEALLKIVWPHAYRIAYALILEDALAQDAAQDACATIYLRIRRLRSALAFTPWLYRIVTRAASDARRKNSRAAQRAVYALKPVNLPDPSSFDLQKAIIDLPIGIQTCLVLHYYADLNSSEIGEILGVPAPTVRSRLSNARKHLKMKLHDEQSFSTSGVTV